MKDSIKNYYENEVLNITTPPMPTFNSKKVNKPWDNILLTAMAVASMVLVSLPSSYDSEIRKVGISKYYRDSFKESFTRVILNSAYYMQNKGESND
ncbi:MAG: hypothetical protein OCD02_14585 [Spirochaetaceae bacterium]